MHSIRIFLNERLLSIPGETSTGALRDRERPDADLVVVNGYPAGPEQVLHEGDRVVLIRKGDIPPEEELEALMTARHTPGVHEKMKAGIVGIAGLGGLGSAAAVALARMGVGSLILADFDVVEPSNLNRQHYMVEHIGRKKTDAMSRVLSSINPYGHVTTHCSVLTEENLPLIFQDADIVLECLDRAEAKAMLVRTLSATLPEIWIIGASGVAGYGESNRIRTHRLGNRVFMVGDLETDARPGRGLMAPRVGIAAHHQANLAVSLLMGEVPEDDV
jgi:sulfur carrier protein ThiS adenylyltransferase